MATTQALKVVAEGMITSFRYPHFMVQKHLTYEMPPPATLYGHICSAVGDWIDPHGLDFAFNFTYEAKVFDYEYIHTTEGTGEKDKVVPLNRELLFRPRLVLYINRIDLLQFFRRPRYTVVLGRSQDLFSYTSVEVVPLEQADRAYYENTLLPYSYATRVSRGVVVNMPRFVDYSQHRQANFARYLLLQGKVVFSPVAKERTDTIAYVENGHRPHIIDPSIRDRKGNALGLAWHSFVEDDYDYRTAAVSSLPADDLG